MQRLGLAEELKKSHYWKINWVAKLEFLLIYAKKEEAGSFSWLISLEATNLIERRRNFFPNPKNEKTLFIIKRDVFGRSTDYAFTIHFHP